MPFARKVIARNTEGPRAVSAKSKEDIIPKLTIVIADDEEAICDQLERIAFDHFPKEIQGKLQIIKVYNGAAVLKQAKEDPSINLFLLDINMPLMDGLQAAQRIRRIKEHEMTPVFFVTAADDEMTQRIEKLESVEKGVYELLHKPINEAEVRRLIKREIRHQIENYRISFAARVKESIAEFDNAAKKRNLLTGSSPFTGTHSYRVRIYAQTIGEASVLDHNPAELWMLGRGVMEHDKGKIIIPRRILEKPGKLSDEDYSIMKLHPVITPLITSADPVELLSPNIFYDKYHHERFSGGGYPSGRMLAQQNTLQKEFEGRSWPVKLNLGISTVSIGDTGDAKLSIRPYSQSEDQAQFGLMALNKELLKHMFTQFHPLGVEAFYDRLNFIVPDPTVYGMTIPDLNFMRNGYLFACSMLNKSSLAEKIWAYVLQDADPEDIDHTEKILKVKQFIAEEILLPYFREQASLNNAPSPHAFRELFQNRAKDFAQKTQPGLNWFTIHYHLLEEGWALNLWDLLDAEFIAEEALARIRGLSSRTDRLRLLTEINDAHELLALLSHLFRMFSRDYAEKAAIPVLQQRYQQLQKEIKVLDTLRHAHLHHDDEKIVKTMDLFERQVKALIDQMKGHNLEQGATDLAVPFAEQEIQRILTEAESFFDQQLAMATPQ